MIFMSVTILCTYKSKQFDDIHECDHTMYLYKSKQFDDIHECDHTMYLQEQAV